MILASFRYKARTKRGDAIEGSMEAVSSTAVAGQLISSGMTPVDIQEETRRAAGGIGMPVLLRQRPRIEDLILFSRQMHSLSKAGVPLLQALSGLAQTTRHAELARTIGGVRVFLEEGRDLATALSNFPQVFNLFYVSMVRVGETSGKLDEIFLQLAHYLERDKNTRDQVKAAVRYPLLVLGAIAVAVTIINMLVIPAFAKVFAAHGADLPLVTRGLIAASNLMLHYWPALLMFAAVAVSGLRYWLASESGRYRWDKVKLRLPLLGGILHRAVMARFSRLFAIATGAGVPLITTLAVVARALDNAYVEERVLAMQGGLERGETLTRTAQVSGMFDGLVLQMLAVGEETGSVEELLREVANYYDKEVEYDVNRLGAAVEPILTVAIAGIVLVLALGVFLPMWSMADLARRH